MLFKFSAISQSGAATTGLLRACAIQTGSRSAPGLYQTGRLARQRLLSIYIKMAKGRFTSVNRKFVYATPKKISIY